MAGPARSASSRFAQPYVYSSPFSAWDVAGWPTFRHNTPMRRQFGSTLFASCLCLLALGPVAHADDPRMDQATVMVRAFGGSGSITASAQHHVPARPLNQRATPREVHAGSISRSVLQAELASGVGRFLQQVHTEAVVSQGHFVGWRLLALFAQRSDVHISALRAGDVVLRVNGQSIERPETFKAIWDSLEQASALVLDIEREGQPAKLRFSIVD
jgi:hypothetical protein